MYILMFPFICATWGPKKSVSWFTLLAVTMVVSSIMVPKGLMLSLELDMPSWLLTMLCGFILPLTSMSSNLNQKNIWAIMTISVSSISFLMKSFLGFYFWFELSLLFMVMAILGWGYQPERLLAAKVIMLYTMGGSLILFINIIMMMNEGDVLLKLLTTGTSASMQMLFEVGIFFAFLIKLPLYGFHVWLPMAHVEAPMWGSMVLASIMLKLGGYGMVRVIQLMSNKMKWVIILMVVLSLMSFILCCTIVDMKMIVAYSSVGHMSMGLGALLTMSYFGKQSLIVNMLAHGAASSMMFMYVTFLYMKSGSRSLMYNKGMLILNPMMMVMWYVVCVINMGGPLTPSLYVEVIQTVSLFNMSKVLGLMLFGVIVLSLLFNMILFNFPAKENIMKGMMKMSQDSNIMMSGYFHLAMTLLVLAIIWLTNF